MNRKVWGIVASLLDGHSGWMLRGKCLGAWTFLWTVDYAEAVELQGYLRSGLTVEESFAKQHARIDKERE